MLYVITLTYILKVTKIEIWIFWNHWGLTKNDHLWLYRGWYSPSIGTIVSVVLCDLDLIIQGHKFESYYLENDESCCKNASYDLYTGWYSPSNGTKGCEYCITWPWLSFSMSNIFLLCICKKKIVQAADVPSRFSLFAQSPPWSSWLCGCNCLIWLCYWSCLLTL